MLKLGSNRKTMGMGVNVREYSVDNKRVCTLTELTHSLIVGIAISISRLDSDFAREMTTLVDREGKNWMILRNLWGSR